MTHQGDQQVAPTGHNALCPYIGESMPFDSPSASSGQAGAGIPHDDFIVTTKNENSSAELSTEILPLHYVQGQNDIEPSAFYFQSNDVLGAGFKPAPTAEIGASAPIYQREPGFPLP